jgi:adenylate cyclase
MSLSYISKAAGFDFSTFHVMVVDDSRTLRKILVQELHALGITSITQAVDGLDALAQLKDTQTDLMLLDMEMPQLDGFGVLEALKAENRLEWMSVIVISGADELEKTIRCIEIGADDYLPKPFNTVLFRARVVSAFEKKRLRDLDRERLENLSKENYLLEIEQMKTEKLMLNILPRPIADRLKRGEKNISGSYPDVSVIFSDLVGFTKMCTEISSAELVKLLNNLFTRFDKRAESIGLEKIKTIGDAYMAVGGLPIPRPDHAVLCAEMALGMFDDLQAFNLENGAALDMRIGINSGPVVAGVIGFTKFSYDLWGSAVNIASRMESTAPTGRIQISSSTYDALGGEFSTSGAGAVECKGLGTVQTYFLMGKK